MKRNLILSVLLLIGKFVIAQPITNGLIGYWSLNDTSVAQDLSSNQNDGVTHQVVAAADRHGNPNGALSFSNGSYIDFGNVLNIGLNDLTTAAWVKIDPSSTGARIILSKSVASSADHRFSVFVNEENKIRVVFDYGPLNTAFQGTTVLQPDTWYFVAVTFDRDASAKIYINDVLDHIEDISGSNGVDMQANWPLRIGEYSGDGLHFIGDIDDVSMYDRVLSSQEINTLFANGNTVGSSLCSNIYCDGDNVGIGTTTTGSHRLAVEGSIGARRVKVELNSWSDFVFDSDYELKSLNEVERFIADNGHLPDVPSEEEVLGQGVSLGEMDAKLLQKIEELTLYLIEQNKVIQKQQAEIEELKKKVQ